mmetsp:Transcript_3903/g.5937  ORF Transcript_3903/g.5937 Transcript_3903/m.5937 type:complete len:277 (+) Transcript_3903:316-1146(+)
MMMLMEVASLLLLIVTAVTQSASSMRTLRSRVMLMLLNTLSVEWLEKQMMTEARTMLGQSVETVDNRFHLESSLTSSAASLTRMAQAWMNLSRLMLMTTTVLFPRSPTTTSKRSPQEAALVVLWSLRTMLMPTRSLRCSKYVKSFMRMQPNAKHHTASVELSLQVLRTMPIKLPTKTQSVALSRQLMEVPMMKRVRSLFLQATLVQEVDLPPLAGKSSLLLSLLLEHLDLLDLLLPCTQHLQKEPRQTLAAMEVPLPKLVMRLVKFATQYIYVNIR